MKELEYIGVILLGVMIGTGGGVICFGCLAYFFLLQAIEVLIQPA